MNKKRKRWWRYIRRVIRDYPELKQELDSLRSQSITANMTGMPRGSGAGRTVENIALRELSPDDQKDFEAVAKAIEVTELKGDGQERLAMIKYMYWQEKEHTVRDAALQIPVSEATARRWHGDFVRLVGSCRGFIVDTPVPK